MEMKYGVERINCWLQIVFRIVSSPVNVLVCYPKALRVDQTVVPRKPNKPETLMRSYRSSI